MKKTTILATILFLSIALCLMTVCVSATPTIRTDGSRTEYYWGETVPISGEGFTPGAQIQLVVVGPEGAPAYAPWTVYAGDDGSFATSFVLGYDAVGYFTVTATEVNNPDITASMIFLDGPPPPAADLDITAFTSTSYYTKTFGWTIDKSVTPNSWNLFTGDSGTSNYTVTLTKDSGTYHAWINGSISVKNKGTADTVNLAIVVNVTDGQPPPGDLISTVNVDVSSNQVLIPDETGTYLYSIDVPPAAVHTGPGTVYEVHAYAIANSPAKNASKLNSLNDPFGELILVNDVVHVTDTNVAGTWTFGASGKESYLKTFAAPSDQGTHDNTATIQETGQSHGASVTVNCYTLQVSKDATESWNRTYSWTVEKSADHSSLTLSPGGTHSVNYNVTVNATYTDAYGVSGVITIHNPAPIAANITDITDVVSTDIAANIIDNPTFPHILEAGGTLTLHYTTYLPDMSSRTNNATAILQNYDYNYSGIGTLSGTTGFSGTAAVDFSEITANEINKSVQVSDTLEDSLGTATCGVDALPKTWLYSRTIGPYAIIGDYTVANTASVKIDTTTLASADWTVTVHVIGGAFVGVTSSGFVKIDTFKLIFTPDVPTYPSYSRLTASNPGQFYFNIYYMATTGTETFTVEIPYPFVTQGANPVQIYDAAPSGYTPTGTVINSQFSIVGAPWLIADWGTNTFGATHEITITNDGYTGPMYITIHLDYGLKKVAGGYSKDLDLDANSNLGKSTYASILNDQDYTFSVTAPFTDSDTISNLNVFKNDPGIGGLVFNSYGPIVGAKVQIYQGKTLLGTVYTDADGWYMFNYKYTGKATSFTVKTAGFADQTVTLKSNGFLVVNFGIT